MLKTTNDQAEKGVKSTNDSAAKGIKTIEKGFKTSKNQAERELKLQRIRLKSQMIRLITERPG